MPVDDSHYIENYNTPLSEQNQQYFQNWAAQATQKLGINAADLYDYDMQGYWLNGGHAQPLVQGMHFPDTYKKPSHETFSDQSIYHGVASPYGGNWQGGTWGPNEQFKPSEWQQKYKP